jgi:excisionase family DNA binding protein
VTDERLAVGPNEAAKLLGVGRDRVFFLLNTGQIPSFKLGARRLIPVSALREFVERAVEPIPAGARR